MSTAIEWTEETWNPTTGCDRVSPGCDNCYALTLAKRLEAMGNPRYQVDGDPRTSGPGFGLTLHPDKLDEPLKRKKPTVYFVNSMSDLFHPRVPDEYIARVFAVMALAERHTFQVLTKRPRRMAGWLNPDGDAHARYETAAAALRMDGVEGRSEVYERINTSDGWPLPNVWLGTSIETQEWADRRIPHLLDTPAAVRFLSCEPLLGPVTLPNEIFGWRCANRCGWASADWVGTAPDGSVVCPRCGVHVEDWQRLDWVIAGGESGLGARPMHPEWARSLRDQCEAARVPFFFKQWGGRTPKAGGRELDGRTWDEMPARLTATKETA